MLDWLEMHNLEFGECTVLGSLEGNILMVDCGSMNVKIRESDMEVTDYVENNIVPRYFDAKERAFLLTHFHRDHMSGLRYLLKRDHGFFHRVFVPAASVNQEGRALLIEFALYVFAFLSRQSEYSQMSVSALRIFERLHYALGIGNVYSLSRGSQFDFEGVTYDVLWPTAGDYPFSPLFTEIVDELDVCLSSPFLGRGAPEFLTLKNEFCGEYLRLCQLTAPQNRGYLGDMEESLSRCKKLLDTIEAMAPSLQLIPAAQNIIEVLSRPAVREEYANAQNMASIVFQNHRTREASLDDIIMTGDATPETFDQISEDLYDAYYIFKAPHHGTASSWSHLFKDILKSHILISNGDYHAGGGVCMEWAEDEGIKHCSNNAACAWFQEKGSCCNRTAYCWEICEKGAMTLRCPKVTGGSRDSGCGIYVISFQSDRGCFCDGDETPSRSRAE